MQNTELCIKRQRDPRTLVLQEITHLRPPRKHELCHVLDDLGFGLQRHCCEPFL